MPGAAAAVEAPHRRVEDGNADLEGRAARGGGRGSARACRQQQGRDNTAAGATAATNASVLVDVGVEERCVEAHLWLAAAAWRGAARGGRVKRQALRAAPGVVAPRRGPAAHRAHGVVGRELEAGGEASAFIRRFLGSPGAAPSGKESRGRRVGGCGAAAGRRVVGRGGHVHDRCLPPEQVVLAHRAWQGQWGAVGGVMRRAARAWRPQRAREPALTPSGASRLRAAPVRRGAPGLGR